MAKAMRQVSTRAIAEIYGVHRDTVLSWAADGCPCTRQGPGLPFLFDAGEVETWLRRESRSLMPGRPISDDGEALRRAKLQLTIEKAMRERLKRQVEEGALHNSAECEAQIVAQVHATKSELLSLARSVAPELAGKGREQIEKILARRIVEILRHFAGQETA